MESGVERALNRFMATHHGVIDRRHALGLGLSAGQVSRAQRTGRWERVFPGAYQRGGARLSPLGAALAACWSLGPRAVVSHRSAALVWDLVEEPPRQPSVSIPTSVRVRRTGIELHRTGDLDPTRTLQRHNLPATDPLRTLVDLGQVLSPDALDAAIDRAIVRRLVGVPALQAELARLACSGRRGPAALRQALQRRGLVDAPGLSVLESQVLRLLRAWGIPVVSVQTVTACGRYRLDFMLRPDVALEVDGYAYHWSPESKSADAARRADLASMGITVIEADWSDVRHRPAMLQRRILRVLARLDGCNPGAESLRSI